MQVSPIKSTTFGSVVATRRSEPVSQELTTGTEIPVQNIEVVNSNSGSDMKRGVNPLAVTGWTAVGGFGVAALGGIARFGKLHKIAALVGVCAAAAHVGLVYGHRHNHHKPLKDIQA